MRKHADMLSHEALQGAFAEHQVMLQKLQLPRKIQIRLIRLANDLDGCDGIIIPGGGSQFLILLCNKLSEI